MSTPPDQPPTAAPAQTDEAGPTAAPTSPRSGTDAATTRELVDIPAIEVISRAAVMLMSAAADQLGLADPDPERPAHRDLDQARVLITALAGLVNASAPDLGPHAAAFRDGLAGLQGAFREYSVFPDEPGHGPGEGRPDGRCTTPE